jgi:8-oxo-dGTP diphosphatase
MTARRCGPDRRKGRRSSRVGVGVIVVREDCFLIGRRLSAHGFGTWSFPGGTVEDGETPARAARRELLEEAGLTADEVSLVGISRDSFEASGATYLTLHFLCRRWRGEPQLREPHRFESWRWAPARALPRPLFLPIQTLLQSPIWVSTEPPWSTPAI